MNNISKLVDHQANLTVYIVSGEVSLEDIKTEIQRFYEGNITKDVLWDLSECDVSKVTFKDIQNLAYIPRKHYKTRTGGKTAIVAHRDITYGLSRVYASLTELQALPFETKSFRSIKEAREWLAANR